MPAYSLCEPEYLRLNVSIKWAKGAIQSVQKCHKNVISHPRRVWRRPPRLNKRNKWGKYTLKRK